MPLPPATQSSNLPRVFLGIVASLLILQQVFVRLISEQFIYEADLASASNLAFVLSQMAAGFVFLFLLPLVPRITPDRPLVAIAILVGFALRFLMFGSTPVMEVDFYRYLWDGAVTASGFNPYLFSPEAIAQGSDPDLLRLAEDAGHIVSRINYADLRTIYPPLTQSFFALAFWIDNWDLNAWRIVLLGSEFITLGLILQLLRTLNRSSLWSLVYWWNPLLIHETYNTLHMDILLAPFLLIAILLMIRQKNIMASAALTLAAGIKLWPLLLLPFALRPLLAKPRQLLTALFAIVVVASITIAPLFIYGLGEQSGLMGYAQDWVRNSALFPLLNKIIWFSDEGIIRILIALALTTLVLALNRRPITDSDQFIRNLCWVVAALFLLSPTQFPWYAIWFAPLLCLYTQPALLLLTALMPIYYLRFYWATKGETAFFDNFVIWFQYLPVYSLFILNYFQRRRVPAMVSSHV